MDKILDVIEIKKFFQDKIPKIKDEHIIIDINELIEYDHTLYDLLLSNPTEFISHIKLETETLGLFNPQIQFINWRENKDISKIRVRDLNQIVKLDGMISKITDPLALVISKTWSCRNCGTIIKTDGKIPTRCSCGKKSNFFEESSELQDIQELILEELTEKTQGKQPQKIRVRLTDKLTDKKNNSLLKPGNRVSIIGLIDKIPLHAKQDEEIFQYRIFAVNISDLEDKFDDTLNPEDIEEIEQISLDNPIEKLKDSLAPNIWGRDDLKKILLLQMVGGVQKELGDGKFTRPFSHVLVVGSPSCVVGDTYVTMSDGTFKKIQDLKNQVGKKVMIDRWCPKDSSSSSISEFFYNKKRPTKKIVTETGKELICSYNHPLLVKRKINGKTERVWVKAKFLKNEDKIKTITKIPCDKRTYLKIEEPSMEKKGYKKVNIPFCNEEVGLVYGIITGDGWYNKYNIGICYPESEKIIGDISKNIIKNNFGVDCSIVKKTISKKIRYLNGRLLKEKEQVYYNMFYSKTLAEIFKCEKATKKRIPPIIMESKNSVLANFIKGLFSTDGYCTLRKSKYRTAKIRVGFKSKSPKLLLDTQLGLIRFGIQSKIYGDALYIDKIEDVKRFRKHIGFLQEKKQKNLDKVKEMNFKGKKHLKYEKIRSIEEGGIKDVYDVSIQKYHRFISNGLVSHNTSKSELAKNIHLRCPKSFYTSGDNASGVGLVAAVEKDELLGSWGVSVGPIIKASGSNCIVDEIDKVPKDQLKALHTPMESGFVKIAKAGIDASFIAETSILALANPKHGVFDDNKQLVEQINLPPALLSRFDIIYTLKDEVDKDNDDKITEIIYSTKGKEEGLIPVQLFRKYITYARTFKPELQKEHLKDLQDFYHDVRKKSISKNSNMKGLPIGTRHLQGLIRLAEASAKIRLSNKVEKEDFDLAKKLFYDSLIKIGMDEGGIFDLQRITSGVTISKRKLMDVLLDKIRMLCVDGKTVKDIDLRTIMKENGMNEDDYYKTINELNRECSILKTSEGWKLY